MRFDDDDIVARDSIKKASNILLWGNLIVLAIVGLLALPFLF